MRNICGKIISEGADRNAAPDAHSLDELVAGERFGILKDMAGDISLRPAGTNNPRTLHQRYCSDETRAAYQRFAGSRILTGAYSLLTKRVFEALRQKQAGELVVADAGIGEGMMWRHVLDAASIETPPSRSVCLYGIDFSPSALWLAEAKLQISVAGFRVNLIPKCMRLDEIDFTVLLPAPDWLIASLSLHHLTMDRKRRLLNEARRAKIGRLTIVEVNADLDNENGDCAFKNLAALHLYEDVFESVRNELPEAESGAVLECFYKPELVKILSSDMKTLDERFISLARWEKLVTGAGYRIDSVTSTYCGVKGRYEIFVLEAQLPGDKE
ncbi:MAG: class I SAM-dependent methyltransferase [Myxococcota bacterium]|jgi:ubiquinone/menaquinone biosynthesis C-methylase UbiE